MTSMRNQDPVLTAADAERLIAALDALGLGWWIKDSAGRYLRVGQAAASMLDAEPAALIGRLDGELMPAVSAQALAEIEARAMHDDAVQPTEATLELGGVRRDLACAAVRLTAEPSALGATLGLWLDRSALRAREAELRVVLGQLEAHQQAQRAMRAEADSAAARGAQRVVGQAAFQEQLAREIDLSQREHREFAVVLIAVDAGGPGLQGDLDTRRRIVEVFDGMLRGNTRAMDVPSRHDEEEFALLLSGVGLATAHSRMEGLRRQCATQVVARRAEALHFTVSMGIASYPHTSPTRAGLLSAAQTALEQARGRGGNQVALASIAFPGGDGPRLSL